MSEFNRHLKHTVNHTIWVNFARILNQRINDFLAELHSKQVAIDLIQPAITTLKSYITICEKLYEQCEPVFNQATSAPISRHQLIFLKMYIRDLNKDYAPYLQACVDLTQFLQQYYPSDRYIKQFQSFGKARNPSEYLLEVLIRFDLDLG